MGGGIIPSLENFGRTSGHFCLEWLLIIGGFSYFIFNLLQFTGFFLFFIVLNCFSCFNYTNLFKCFKPH